MATATASSDQSGWTTVVKKAYVPPAARAAAAKKEAEEEAKKPLNLASESLFPTLGKAASKSAPPAKTTSWGSGKTGVQLAKQLVELDKQTEEQRAAAEEKLKALEGWYSLPLPNGDKEYMIACAESIFAQEREGARILALEEIGCYGGPPHRRTLSHTPAVAISNFEGLEDFASDLEEESSE